MKKYFVYLCFLLIVFTGCNKVEKIEVEVGENDSIVADLPDYEFLSDENKIDYDAVISDNKEQIKKPNMQHGVFESIFVEVVEKASSRYSLDEFCAILKENGYECYQSEGIAYVDDPEYPGSYIAAILTNENEIIEIAILSYCRMFGDDQFKVNVIFSEDKLEYYIGEIFLDGGTKVLGVKDLVDYMGKAEN